MLPSPFPNRSFPSIRYPNPVPFPSSFPSPILFSFPRFYSFPSLPKSSPEAAYYVSCYLMLRFVSFFTYTRGPTTLHLPGSWFWESLKKAAGSRGASTQIRSDDRRRSPGVDSGSIHPVEKGRGPFPLGYRARPPFAEWVSSNLLTWFPGDGCRWCRWPLYIK